MPAFTGGLFLQVGGEGSSSSWCVVVCASAADGGTAALHLIHEPGLRTKSVLTGTNIFDRTPDRFLLEGAGHIASPALHALASNSTGKAYAGVCSFAIPRIEFTSRDLHVYFREFACKISRLMCSSAGNRVRGRDAAALFTAGPERPSSIGCQALRRSLLQPLTL